VTQIFSSGLSDHGGDHKTFEMITSTLTLVQCRSKPPLNYGGLNIKGPTEKGEIAGAP
jgi:hypothetical protein